ncbi:MAG: hypothetical protein ACO3DS_02515, partial [Phycisphaerales bacterium]
DSLRGLINAQPFRPFRLYLADGQAVDVVHHDFALLSGNGRSLVVSAPRRDSDIRIISPMLIVSTRYLDELEADGARDQAA